MAIGLGSNLGDRLANLRFGTRALRTLVEDVACSSVYETEPRHLTGQPPFLNACCTGCTRLTPRQLLSELQHVERLAGRRQGGPRYGPRILDLDLLLYGARQIRRPGLVVPHERLRSRAFVLVPLEEIAADWTVPGGGEPAERSVGELAKEIGMEGVERTDLRLEEA